MHSFLFSPAPSVRQPKYDERTFHKLVIQSSLQYFRSGVIYRLDEVTRIKNITMRP